MISFRILTPMLLCLAYITNVSVAQADDNLKIDGSLVKEPCVMNSDENSKTIEFGTIIQKGLYKDVRTPSIPFSVILTDCDLDLGSSVYVLLDGTESLGLKGYLATTGSGSAGIAVGIETPEGINMPIDIPAGEPLPVYPLAEGTLEIPLRAYIEAVPDALENHSLQPGEFSATLTMGVSYP